MDASAGASLLSADDGPPRSLDTRPSTWNMSSSCTDSDGGPSSTQTAGHLRMHGQEIFRHAVVKLHDVIEEALEANGVTADDIDWIVPHQANRRIMLAMARKLGLPESKVMVTIDRHANTSAASIPLALADGRAKGLLKRAPPVLLEALGGGLAWGHALLRW